mmetsp:Transcript_37883/g.62654  ORF Transcript_37883/g.62654 Transcript_37883/m.62654 type:complete len:120 (+) Transcript_37883:64-423(+)
MGTIGWRRTKISSAELAGSQTAQQVMQTRWAWGGVPGFVFNKDGSLVTPWGSGTWGFVATANGEDDGREEDGITRCVGCFFADFANANHNLKFDFTKDPPVFKSVRVGDMETVLGSVAQ